MGDDLSRIPESLGDPPAGTGLYRRRPQPPVRAYQFMGEGGPTEGVYPDGSGRPSVITIQGQLVPVCPGEWVVTEPSNPNRHYPIADSEFRRLYEPAD